MMRVLHEKLKGLPIINFGVFTSLEEYSIYGKKSSSKLFASLCVLCVV